MAQAARVEIPMTNGDFRSWAERQPGKWELVDGQPRAMAPASATHGLIQARAASLVDQHLERSGSPCRAATEAPVVPTALKRHNARVPDLSVTCSPQPEDQWELADPVFVLEILSPSNERDTRDNVWAYMTIPSMREILLLDSTAARGELLVRRPDGGWPEQAEGLSAGDVVRIGSIGFTCALREFYTRTRLVARGE